MLASRLLGPLQMSGKQTGWIYGTIYLGCIISPLIAGQIADRWVATQYFLAAAHLVGGVLLLASARHEYPHQRLVLFQRSAVDELSRSLLPAPVAVRRARRGIRGRI